MKLLVAALALLINTTPSIISGGSSSKNRSPDPRMSPKRERVRMPPVQTLKNRAAQKGINPTLFESMVVGVADHEFFIDELDQVINDILDMYWENSVEAVLRKSSSEKARENLQNRLSENNEFKETLRPIIYEILMHKNDELKPFILPSYDTNNKYDE